MVWDLSLPPTRVVSLRCDTNSISNSINSTWGTSLARIPVSLHVCRESRKEALKTYQLRFSMAGPPKVFFGPKVDILHFGVASGWMASSAQFFTALSMCHPSELKDIRFLAVDEKVLGSGKINAGMAPSVVRLIRQIPMRMPGLEALIFVRDTVPHAFKHSPLLQSDDNHDPELRKLVECAIRKVHEEFPNWTIPLWVITKMRVVIDCE
ncbi:hypothetical protein CLIM01_14633 [Colletotrichum limetticola]|uniref:2EXR domain-containing protein n=1 Tax=Colletotrichum limetticola TaxID=1209924 RepID=A0ABQ9PC73_9PEZI|nr:hypothetical protein CLIM01_14633 [Colletotrichum limetticola]